MGQLEGGETSSQHPSHSLYTLNVFPKNNTVISEIGTKNKLTISDRLNKQIQEGLR